MSPRRSRYRELGLDLVSLEDNCSLQPKWPPMVEEKRYNGAEDPIKLFLMEALAQTPEPHVGKFSQILQRFPTIGCVYSSRSHFGDASPFKVLVNFDIPIFEC
jgi:hypothetical protein